VSGDVRVDDRTLRFVTWLVPGIEAAVFELVASAVGEVTGRPVELVVESGCSGPADAGAFDWEGVDLGWMCATAYLPLGTGSLVGVGWTPDDPGCAGEGVYFSDLVVGPGSGVVDLASLEGRRVACNDPVSLSGNHGLRLALAEAGHEPDDHAVTVFTGGHLASLAALGAGEVDAAVVDSVTRVVHRPDLLPVARLGPWPVQPLVASPAMASGELRRVRDAVLALGGAPAVMGELRRCGLGGFVPVTQDRYRALAERLATHGLLA
jgi:ABC-type phosphate/phosphonate transport system substrate-binding protein